ncbi:NUDIX domain-containing protein [Rhodococcus sp. ABRD24]|uniref:NUDIX hydrolase n=1 Tax=Rhodococcus sp. ABRD24 TaxID=2507582 RepID=UPI001040D7FD|nr:NUDIX domain-containing protein [Rhodococcus sp. ABRD24]QBJ96998.1 NUDIX domain-containing protein [Rhodococcus sp. ABRD24]
MTMLRSVLTAVTDWVPHTAEQTRARAEFLQRLVAGEAVLRRSPLPTHVTASLFVLDPQRIRILLCHHRKGGFWVQPGGHLEPDDRSIEDAAVREAVEETGIPRDAITGVTMADLDHHPLGAGFRGCRSHLDIAFVGTTDPAVPVVVSDESQDVRWFPVDGLPPNTAPGLDTRLAQVLDRVRPT